MKYTLILGGAGFIGANLAREYLKYNCNVIVYDNTSGREANLSEIKDEIIIFEGLLSIMSP